MGSICHHHWKGMRIDNLRGLRQNKGTERRAEGPRALDQRKMLSPESRSPGSSLHALLPNSEMCFLPSQPIAQNLPQNPRDGGTGFWSYWDCLLPGRSWAFHWVLGPEGSLTCNLGAGGGENVLLNQSKNSVWWYTEGFMTCEVLWNVGGFCSFQAADLPVTFLNLSSISIRVNWCLETKEPYFTFVTCIFLL